MDHSVDTPRQSFSSSSYSRKLGITVLLTAVSQTLPSALRSKEVLVTTVIYRIDAAEG